MLNKIYFYLFLICIILVNIIIGYPQSYYPEGHPDTYYNIMLSNSIIENKGIIWIESGWSFLGRYPFSYPAGNAICIASFQSLQNLFDPGPLIFIYSSILSLIGILGCILLLNDIFHKNEVSLLALSFFAITPVFIWFTAYSATSRIIMFSLTPIIFFTLVRYHTTQSRIWLILLFIFVLTVLVSHSTGIVILIIVISYFIYSYLILHIKPTSYKKFIKQKNYRIFVSSVVVVYIFIFNIVLLINSKVQLSYEKFLSGYMNEVSQDLSNQFINLMISYFGKLFMLTIIALIAFILHIKYAKPHINVIIMIWGIFVFIFLAFPEYNSYLILPWLAVLAAYGIALINFRQRSLFFPLLFVLIVISSSIFSSIRIYDWNHRFEEERGLGFGNINDDEINALLHIQYNDKYSSYESNDYQFQLGRFYLHSMTEREGDAFSIRLIDFNKLRINIKSPKEIITDFPRIYEMNPPLWKIKRDLDDTITRDYYVINNRFDGKKFTPNLVIEDDISQEPLISSYDIYRNELVTTKYIRDI